MQSIRITSSLVALATALWASEGFNNTNAMGAFGSSPVSANVTITAGTNLAAFAVIEWGNAAGTTVTTITLGGTPMTQCGTVQNTTNNEYVGIWALANPPTGTVALAFATNVNEAGHYNVVTFTGVDQSNPCRTGTFTSATGASAHPALTVSSATGDYTLTVLGAGAASLISSTTPTDQTSDGIDNTGTFEAGSDHSTSANGDSKTHTWNLSTSDNYALAGVSIKAAGGGATPVIHRGRIF